MPSLRSIFTLQDNYSRAMDRIYSSTQQATGSIGRASAAVDNVNTQFTASEGAASRLTSKLTTLAATFVSLATLKKGMDISDTYTNTVSKLNLITGSLEKTKTLQQEIFSAADRARGSYTDMADTVAKLGIIAGEQFGSNDNIVKFTETLQKMFKVSGTPTANQSGALLQIQQAIGMGKLQGQDLRILAEDAPLVETAIAKYMKKSTGEIKKLGADGKITSDVLINSVMQYANTIDKQIGGMSYTWGDYWNKIKNGATQAFSGVFGDVSKILGSNKFKSMIDGIVGSFYTLAGAAEKVLNDIITTYDFFASNWSIIAPILLTIAGAYLAMQLPILAAAAATVWKTVCDWAETAAIFAMIVAQDGLNAALAACPITWIIAGIAVLIGLIYLIVAAVNKWGNQTLSATGIIVGAIFVAAAAVWNIAIGLLNGLIQLMWTIFVEPFLGIIEWVLNAANGGFNGFGGAVANLIGQIIGWFLSLGQVVTKIIDAIFGTNWTAGLESLRGAVTAWGKNDKAITLTGGNNAAPTIGQRWDPAAAGNAGYKFGQGIDSSVKNWTDKLGNLGKVPNITIPSTAPIPKGPTTVKGTGADGSVQVNIADQDLQYLRDLAEKQYINKFSTAVLSPKLSVSFTGNAGDKDNQQQIYSTIGKMLKEELATAAEGYYPV